jgi:hypothetical protein
MERRFSRSRGPDERDHLSALQFQADTSQDRAASAKGFRDVAHVNNRLGLHQTPLQHLAEH